nr:PREDICTED: probable hydrolase PNKD [Latimeria chalumnae]|eukprot:XP_014351324.1 PREDICTED: probable hydrolase PNKD [Latimeria chalumnae]
MALHGWLSLLAAAAAILGGVYLLCVRNRSARRSRWLRRILLVLMARTEKPLFRIAYTLYTKTKLGYMFYKRQVKKAREHHPTGHSVTQPTVLNGVKIIPISVIEDNYSYLIIDTTSDTAVAVDPSDPQVVQQRDHSGGNKTLKKLYKKCRVYGSSTDNIPGLTEVNLSLCFCSPHHPGHEYAQDNLKFAAEIEPNNTECEAKFQWVMTQRQGKLCTCPSTIGEEKSYNPFLRTHLQELHEALGLQHTPDDDFTRFRAQVLEEVRKRKDLFKAR